MYKLGALACLLLALPSAVFSQSSCSGSIGTSTGGRKIGIVIDSSGSMVDTDPSNLRIVAGKAVASSLITKAAAGSSGHPDLVTVIDFDDSVRVVYPLGDPAAVSFDGIDSSGGTYIALGVQAAIDQITQNTGDVVAHISGIVVFTDGQDSFVTELVAQLNRAQGLGIRVSFGFLSPFATTSSQDPSILSAILATGGTYATIGDSTAQASFVSLVLAHGLTDTDHAGGTNSLLLPGLLTAGNVSASSGTETFTYDAISGEALNFTVTAITDETFDFTLHDSTAKKDIGSASTDPTTFFGSILFTASAATSLDLIVSTKNTTAGLFSVSLSSSVNRTITVCGAGNTTAPRNTTTPANNSTGLTPNNTSVSTPTTPTSTARATFTGGAAVMKTYATGALFPAILAAGALFL